MTCPLHRHVTLDPDERSEMELFLGSHIEWEHISIDAVERFGTDCLGALDDDAVEWLAEHYDYFSNGD